MEYINVTSRTCTTCTPARTVTRAYKKERRRGHLLTHSAHTRTAMPVSKQTACLHKHTTLSTADTTARQFQLPIATAFPKPRSVRRARPRAAGMQAKIIHMLALQTFHTSAVTNTARSAEVAAADASESYTARERTAAECMRQGGASVRPHATRGSQGARESFPLAAYARWRVREGGGTVLTRLAACDGPPP